MMNKKTTWLIIGLMATALIGLTSFQIYWINNAIKLNEKRFKENVFESLNNVVYSLENQEVVHLAGSEFVFINAANHETRIKHLPDSNIEVITEENTDSLKTVYKSELRVERINDTLTNAKFIAKEKAVKIVIDRLSSDKRTLVERIEKTALDSLLRKSLNDQGIDIGFQFAVWNSARDSVIYTNARSNIESLKNSDLKASLFPNDIIDNMSYLAINFPNQNGFLFKEVWLTLLTSVVFILTIIGCFSYAIHTIFRQKKLSEIKNDFINNMTHEFKTPIATVSLACQALGEPELQNNRPTVSRYVQIIDEENKRLSKQVEKVLQSALIDKETFNLKKEAVNIDTLIEEAINNVRLTLESKRGIVKKTIQTNSHEILADPEHLRNALHNLLDNAIKYSQGAPLITIKVSESTSHLAIAVEDNGIGIKPGDQAHVFDKFYRVSTGNRHDIKGFGLGLSYVKTIAEKHGGHVQVSSDYGKGSTFTIKLSKHHG